MVAERQGQTAALNMLGSREPFSAVPFFWSRHYDVSIHYVGHAEHWDKIEIEGNVAKGDCLVRYLRGGEGSRGRVDGARCRDAPLRGRVRAAEAIAGSGARHL